MKILFTLSTLIAIHSSVAQEYNTGRTIKTVRVAAEISTDKSVCATAANNAAFCSSTPGCAKGTSYFKCYNGIALPPKPCADPTPYCSGGVCVPDPPSGCSSSDVTCPGEGYFPVLSTCLQYTYCYFDSSAGDFIATTKSCNRGYSFTPSGPETRKCRRGGQCIAPKCSPRRASEWKGYAYRGLTRNQIALYCVAGKAVRIDACEGGLSIDLAVTNAKKCILKCTANYQLAVYELDNTKYYQCRGGTAYLEQCNFNQVFDGKTLTCVAKTTQAPTTAISTTQSVTSSITQSATQAGSSTTTTQSAMDSTTQSGSSTTQASGSTTTQSLTDSTTQSLTDSTTQSITDSTTQSATDSTTQSATDSTTQSLTDSTTQSITDSTTQSVTDSTTPVDESTTTPAVDSTT